MIINDSLAKLLETFLLLIISITIVLILLIITVTSTITFHFWVMGFLSRVSTHVQFQCHRVTQQKPGWQSVPQDLGRWLRSV